MAEEQTIPVSKSSLVHVTVVFTQVSPVALKVALNEGRLRPTARDCFRPKAAIQEQQVLTNFLGEITIRTSTKGKFRCAMRERI